MVFDITQLKKIRKQLDMTQQKFAREAGISQSMVAKIESGKLDPTYSHVKRIESAVNSMMRDEEESACEIMNKSVKSVNKKDKLRKIVGLMTKYGISQVPVRRNSSFVGLVTESDFLGMSERDLDSKVAEDIMKESPPIISQSAGMSVVVNLLKFYPIILVVESGKFRGVITKADVLKRMK